MSDPQANPMDPLNGWQEGTALNPNHPGGSLWTGGNLSPDDPSNPDPTYRVMAEEWEPIYANLQGVTYLRRNAVTYLPQFPKEKDEHWAGRVQRSVYTPYLARLIRGAAGLILRRPIHLGGGDEAYWANWRLNVDRGDTSLDDFIKTALAHSIGYGHSSILVDYPSAARSNLKEQRDAGDAPFFQQVPPWASIGRRHTPAGGLSQVRIRELVEDPVGAFGIEEVLQIRVITPGVSDVWRKTGGGGNAGGWVLDADRSGTYALTDIPLATTYSNRVGMLFSRPPLIDCAYLNLAHYQRRGDLTQVLTIAGQPILDLAGFDADDGVGLSVNNALLFPIGGGSKYTEISGASCAAMQTELQVLADQITQLGISTLAQQQSFQESGVAKSLDRAESNSMLAIIAKDMEKTLQTAMNWAGQYAGVEPPIVQIDTDFDKAKLDSAEALALLKAYTDGAIDQATFLSAWQQGEWLDESVDIDQIVDDTEAETAQKAEAAMAAAALARPASNDPAAAPGAAPGGNGNGNGQGAVAIG